MFFGFLCSYALFPSLLCAKVVSFRYCHVLQWHFCHFSTLKGYNQLMQVLSMLDDDFESYKIWLIRSIFFKQ